MITETQIQNFLYEIDDELSDDQINSLAQKIYITIKKYCLVYLIKYRINLVFVDFGEISDEQTNNG